MRDKRNVTESFHERLINCRSQFRLLTSVVFPDCRGPNIVTTGYSDDAAIKAASMFLFALGTIAFHKNIDI